LALLLKQPLCPLEFLIPWLLFFVALPFFFCLFLFCFFLDFALLQLLDAFLCLFVFFLLFFCAQGLAVFFHPRGHFLPAEIEKSVLVGLALLHSAVALELRLLLGLRPGIILLDLVDGLLLV